MIIQIDSNTEVDTERDLSSEERLLICKLCRPILSNCLRQQSSFSYSFGKHDEPNLDK